MNTTILHPMARREAMSSQPNPNPGATQRFRQWLSHKLSHGQLNPLMQRRAAAPISTRRDRVAEAAEVRAMAQGYRNSDPGFAADLFAAADRHERIDID